MDSFEKTPKQKEESLKIRQEANRVVEEIRSGRRSGSPNESGPSESGSGKSGQIKRKELKPLINFEADDNPPAFETLFGSERIESRTVRV